MGAGREPGPGILTGIPSDCIDLAWPIAAPLLQLVLDECDTGYSLDDLKAKCKARDMQLWLWGDDAAFLTEIQVFPQHKALHISYIGGRGMFDWFDRACGTFEQFARYMGCKYISGCGRRGWVRQSRQRGWREAYVMTRKEL